MLTLIDFILKLYTAVLLFRLILTQQELTFNPIGKGVGMLTDPLFRLVKVPKNQINKFIPISILIFFSIYGLILGISNFSGSFVLGVLSAYMKMFGFIAIFFVICVLLGSMVSKNTGAFPIFFYRLGNLIVKPIQKYTRINSNLVVVPALLWIIALFTAADFICLAASMAYSSQWVSASYTMVWVLDDIFKIITQLINYLVLIIIIRALLSWFSPDPRNILVQLVYYISEPVLAPFRRYIPPIGLLDLSALVAILALGLLGKLLSYGFHEIIVRLMSVTVGG